MQDTQIVIEFDNTLPDHLHASRVYESHQKVAKINKIVALALALFGFWAVYMSGPLWWTLIWFVLAPIEYFDLLSIRPLQIRIWFKANPKFREHYRLEFNDLGIHFLTDTIDSQIAWNHYNKVLESPRVFVLVYGKMLYSMIPKSAFANEEHINAFRDMLTRHIS